MGKWNVSASADRSGKMASGVGCWRMYDSPWKKQWQPCLAAVVMKSHRHSPESRYGA